jgi:hypothetical protein
VWRPGYLKLESLHTALTAGTTIAMRARISALI